MQCSKFCFRSRRDLSAVMSVETFVSQSNVTEDGGSRCSITVKDGSTVRCVFVYCMYRLTAAFRGPNLVDAPLCTVAVLLR